MGMNISFVGSVRALLTESILNKEMIFQNSETRGKPSGACGQEVGYNYVVGTFRVNNKVKNFSFTCDQSYLEL